MDAEVEYLDLDGIDIEFLLTEASEEMKDFPALVFLHEGLGSIELWRKVPNLISQGLGNPQMLLYSRPGYGNSTPIREDRPLTYMHNEAEEILPKMLSSLGISSPILIGHSDGASIALIHAGAGFPVHSLVLIAPHVMVEAQSVAGIEAARQAYLTTDLPTRLSRYHRDPDSTFWGWNNVWLSDGFMQWNIEEYLPYIKAPILVIQGDQDEYGTTAQLDSIRSQVSGPVEFQIVAGAHHSPHLETPEEVVGRIVNFISQSVSAIRGEGSKWA